MRIGGLEFAGLDIETTGSDINNEAAIIQIGVDLGTYKAFDSDIRPHEGALLQEEAMRVNGFTAERMAAAPTAEEVDTKLAAWLEEQGVGERRLIAIGWNVAGFDIPFVRKFLPKSARFLSYRTIDLNAIVFTLDPLQGQEKLKPYLKKRAEEYLSDAQWHDALFDASAALAIWQILQRSLAPRVVSFPSGLFETVAHRYGEER